jgi:hypothetical protein
LNFGTYHTPTGFITQCLHVAKTDPDFVELENRVRQLVDQFTVPWKELDRLISNVLVNHGNVNEFSIKSGITYDLTTGAKFLWFNRVKGEMVEIENMDQLLKLFEAYGMELISIGGGKYKLSIIDPSSYRFLQVAYEIHYRVTYSDVDRIGLGRRIQWNPGHPGSKFVIAYLQKIYDEHEARIRGWSFQGQTGNKALLNLDWRDPALLALISTAGALGPIGESIDGYDENGKWKAWEVAADGRSIKGTIFNPVYPGLSKGTEGDQAYIEATTTDDFVSAITEWVGREIKTMTPEGIDLFAVSLMQSMMAHVAGIATDSRVQWDDANFKRARVEIAMPIDALQKILSLGPNSNFMKLLAPRNIGPAYLDPNTYNNGKLDRLDTIKEYGFSSGKSYGLYCPDAHVSHEDLFVQWQVDPKGIDSVTGEIPIWFRVGRVDLNPTTRMPMFDLVTKEPMWQMNARGERKPIYDSSPTGTHKGKNAVTAGLTNLAFASDFYLSFLGAMQGALLGGSLQPVYNTPNPIMTPALQKYTMRKTPEGYEMLTSETFGTALDMILLSEEPYLGPFFIGNRLMPYTPATANKFRPITGLFVVLDPEDPNEHVLHYDTVSEPGIRTRAFVALKTKDPNGKDVHEVFAKFAARGESAGVGFSVFVPSNLVHQANSMKVMEQIQRALDKLANEVETTYKKAAESIVGNQIVIDLIQHASEVWNRANDHLIPDQANLFGQLLEEMHVANDAFASKLVKKTGQLARERTCCPVLSPEWIVLMERLATNLLDNLLRDYPMTKGNDVKDANGNSIAGEQAARNQLAEFISFLRKVLSKEVTTSTNGQPYLTNSVTFPDSDFYLQKVAEQGGPRKPTQLSIDMMRQFNRIFEVLLKGVPGVDTTDISNLFDVHAQSDGDIGWGKSDRKSATDCVTGIARLLMMVRLGSVSFEQRSSLRPHYGVVVQAVIERLFSRDTIREDINILAKCNGMGVDFKKGLHEDGNGFIYFEMYYLNNPQYRVLCRVNKATMTLVRDGIDVFYFGTEASPQRPSATIETFLAAKRSNALSAFLASSLKFKTRLIFDVLADATDPLNYP